MLNEECFRTEAYLRGKKLITKDQVTARYLLGKKTVTKIDTKLND